jgi:hypothetical protein
MEALRWLADTLRPPPSRWGCWMDPVIGGRSRATATRSDRAGWAG